MFRVIAGRDGRPWPANCPFSRGGKRPRRKGSRNDLTSFLASFVAGVFIAICAFYIATRGPLAAHDGWTIEGLVTIILASVTVVLAAIGVFITFLTIWGYDRFMQEARATAEKTATEVAIRVAADRTNAIVPRIIEARLDAGAEQGDDEMAGAFAGGETGGAS
ncbi:MAG TPA: hypothetical protein VHY79_10125 [Rhizomicrobium sp.]|nr:hypothetical protein [Rhizomicrobium sp.]